MPPNPYRPALSRHFDQGAIAVLGLDPDPLAIELGPLGYDLVLIGLGATAFVAAARVFCRRDLPAPL